MSSFVEKGITTFLKNCTCYAVRRNIMEQREEIILMLNQIPNPAFLVKDGSVLEINPSAAVQMVTVGTAVQTLLSTGQQEYADYTGGSLVLTLSINGNLHNASISKFAEFYGRFFIYLGYEYQVASDHQLSQNH